MLHRPVEIASVNFRGDYKNGVRNAAFLDRLPAAILWMLIVISAIAMAEAGYNSGSSGTISRMRYTVFCVVLALVIMAITDYDRPRE